MVPGQPRQPSPARAQARIGIEIVAGLQHRLLLGAIGGQCHDRVDRLAGSAVVFSHTNDSLSGWVKISVSITATGRLSDRLRDRRTDLQSVKFLVVEVAEINYAIADQHRA